MVELSEVFMGFPCGVCINAYWVQSKRAPFREPSSMKIEGNLVVNHPRAGFGCWVSQRLQYPLIKEYMP